MNGSFAEVSNGMAYRRSRLPLLPFDVFRREALAIVKAGGKVV